MMLRVLAHETDNWFHGRNFRASNGIKAAELCSLVDTGAADVSGSPPADLQQKSQDSANPA